MAITIAPSRNSPLVRKCQVNNCSGDAVADAQFQKHTSWGYFCKPHLETKASHHKDLITNITNKPLVIEWLD